VEARKDIRLTLYNGRSVASRERSVQFSKQTGHAVKYYRQSGSSLSLSLSLFLFLLPSLYPSVSRSANAAFIRPRDKRLAGAAKEERLEQQYA